MSKEEKLIRAVEVAKSILDAEIYVKWVRECTEDDRNEFYKLYSDLYPPKPEPPLLLRPKESWYCEPCDRYFYVKAGYHSHIKDSKSHKWKSKMLKEDRNLYYELKVKGKL